MSLLEFCDRHFVGLAFLGIILMLCLYDVAKWLITRRRDG